MGLFTSKANGNWSASGQTTWNEVGVPGDGDIVQITHNITVDVDTTIGTGGATGSTEAIRLGRLSDGAARTLTIAAGKTLTCKGDFLFYYGYGASPNVLQLDAGATFTFKPASGQQYMIRSNGYKARLSASGTANSHCTINTDKSLGGLSSLMDNTLDAGESSNFSLAYTDFADFGTTASYGIYATCYLDSSIANCTFTRCNLSISQGGFPGSNTFTFSGNVFSDSVIHAVQNLATYITRYSTGATTVTNNGFDGSTVLALKESGAITCSGNVGNFRYNFAADVSSWTSASTFTNNILRGATINIYGPITRHYFLSNETDNPHFSSPASSGANSFIDCVYEAPELSGPQTDTGDCILGAAFGTSSLIKGCISLPSAGNLVNIGSGGNATTPVTFEHNTTAATFNHGESFSNGVGQVVSFKSNLFINSGLKFYDVAHPNSGGVQNVVLPANIDKNAGYLVNDDTPISGSYANSGHGYRSNFSSVPGLTDLSPLASDPCVNSAMKIEDWCQENYATDGTFADAWAYLLANPTKASETIDGVRNAFKVTGSSGLLLKDAGHDGVTIGAMEYQAPATGGRGMGSKYGHTLLRP